MSKKEISHIFEIRPAARKCQFLCDLLLKYVKKRSNHRKNVILLKKIFLQYSSGAGKCHNFYRIFYAYYLVYFKQGVY